MQLPATIDEEISESAPQQQNPEQVETLVGLILGLLKLINARTLATAASLCSL